MDKLINLRALPVQHRFIDAAVRRLTVEETQGRYADVLASRAADDDLSLLDGDARPGRDPLAVHARPVTRAQIPHFDSPILQQSQQRMLRCGVLVVHEDVAAPVAADAAFPARAITTQPQDGVAVRVDLFDEHHRVHCMSPR